MGGQEFELDEGSTWMLQNQEGSQRGQPDLKIGEGMGMGDPFFHPVWITLWWDALRTLWWEEARTENRIEGNRTEGNKPCPQLLMIR